MSHYTNPAFCQKSEFYSPSFSNKVENNSVSKRYDFIRSQNVWADQSIQGGLQNHRNGQQQQQQQQPINQRKLPPKPGTKSIHLNTVYAESTEANSAKCQTTKTQLIPNGYALVPLEELPNSSKDRYAILPAAEAHMLHNSSIRKSRSQENLDYVGNEFAYEDEDSFTSLPVFTTQDDSQKIVPAFSSDFLNKSMVLLDQSSMQRYTMVPTDDDEEVVDSNHEIIEMCNGRAHRYAVIPTDDEEKSMQSDCGARLNKIHSKTILRQPIEFETLQKPNTSFGRIQRYNGGGSNRRIQPEPNRTSSNQIQPPSMHSDGFPKELPVTPTKNSTATQRLHELLSTPRKCDQETLQRHGSYQTILQRSPTHIPLQQKKLHYGIRTMHVQNVENRTTAIIPPRLQQQMAFNETTSCNEKTLPNDTFQKKENATITIGIISLMLVLTGVLNSGLCLYMVSDMRRSYYLDLGMISGFAAASLGTMGFRSRQCNWLPNRNYISGYVLVTVCSLLNCCGLLVLLGLNPYPGTPFHDLTTGVILALSSLILLMISLGVITSKWCIAPPPDNRVDVY